VVKKKGGASLSSSQVSAVVCSQFAVVRILSKSFISWRACRMVLFRRAGRAA
jgi:hypothetical protein